MTPAPREHMVDVPGGRVWVAEHGGGPGTPLVVLHGGPGMPSQYLAPLTALADERTVVLYDQLGCGRSERPDDRSLWTVSRAVAELEAVRRALGLDRVHLLGHSWGGFLALASAAEHPDAVGSLVLSSPLVSVPGWVEDAASLVARLPEDAREAIARHEEQQTFDAPAYVEATAEFNRRFLCTLDPWPAELLEAFEQMGEAPYRTMWGPSEFTQTGNLRGQDLTPVLPALRVPSLWLAGSQDEVTPERLADFARQASGRVEVLEGGSHCVHLEQPSHYVTLVREFLRGAETM